MRFAEVNKLPAEIDEQIAAEKERLMFHELTQSPSPRFMPEFPHRSLTFYHKSASGAILPTFPCSST
jgi:hypothetical protein